MRIAARRLSLKPLPDEVPVCCFMVQKEQSARSGGEVRDPLCTAYRSDILTRHTASLAAVPDHHFNCDHMPGAVMSDFASGGWLDERPDRSDLVLWLAIHAAHGNEFLFRALTDLLERGFLSQAQEEAVRCCRSRVLQRRTRFWPSLHRKMDRR